MKSLNKVQLIGNLTADPEVRLTPNGQKVANFSVATNYSWKDANGMLQEQTEYHSVVIWGNLAEIVEKFLAKGRKVYIEGRLQTRSWEDQSGVKKYRTETVATNLIILSGNGKDDGSDMPMPSSSAPSEASPQKVRRTKPAGEDEIRVEDIPF